ncbi:uncharacterized protein LOC129407470 isoform X2 [Boleophthalmus pectinirostris]|uniref:uncharacterized protein LOC129407470 isoform X2 n=1 Tax=Boleophthalmus pectinirostris TaxID=150288 RepID=UPI00242F9A8A|nr:uncharacterized protein LOC129407470 isoform X2 [Boleophthalmus pectinirostris]
MPMFCVVYGCANRSNREKGKRFFRVPKVVVHRGQKWENLTERRRKMWIANLRLRPGAAESPNARICSDHFVKGCPSALDDTESVDWAPTVNLGHQKTKPKSETEASLHQEQRMKCKEDHQRWLECAEAILDLQQIPESPGMSSDQTADSPESNQPDDDPQSKGLSENGTLNYQDAGCQTNLIMDDLEKMEDVLRQNTVELGDLRSKAVDTQFSQESFKENEDKTKFYTGLPNFLVLMQIFQLCEPYITCSSVSVLSKFEQLILVLMRLRLNLPLKDLAFRFKISLSTASRVWHKVIDILHERLESQMEWPERHVLQATMPVAFREAFGSRVSIIIDCFEVFIERPSNLLAQAQAWSNYKHHHTVKFLIGVTPQGYVTYISCAWGGRVSDKQITTDSGILRNLLPGDIVLADRGFNIGDSVGFYCASLQVPAFTKGRKELTAYEVADTRKIDNLRIHVERVVGLVRRKYKILQSRAMPIEYMATKPGEALALIDKVGVICCVLSNLSESLVPFK